MNKYVWVGYVSRDTSPIIGQGKWLCSAYLSFTETIKLTDKKKLRNVTN